MRRDMDLVRELLLKLEALNTEPSAIYLFMPDDDEVAIAGFDAHTVEYHYRLLVEAGLVNEGGGSMQGIMFQSLTWAGHDFLDSIRDPVVWENTKKGAAAAGGFTIDLIRDLAKGFLRKKIEELTGVRLG